MVTKKSLMHGVEIILYVAPLVEHGNMLAKYGDYDRAQEKYKEARELRELINEKYDGN